MISEIFTDGAAVTNKVKYSILQWSTAAVHFILIFIFASVGVYILCHFLIYQTILYPDSSIS